MLSEDDDAAASESEKKMRPGKSRFTGVAVFVDLLRSYIVPSWIFAVIGIHL